MHLSLSLSIYIYIERERERGSITKAKHVLYWTLLSLSELLTITTICMRVNVRSNNYYRKIHQGRSRDPRQWRKMTFGKNLSIGKARAR